MNDFDLMDPKYKSAAFILAEKTPRHLNVPTTPPIHWRLEGEILRVLLADGRTVRAPLADQVPLRPAPEPKVSTAPQKIQMVEVPATHIHDNKKVAQPAPVAEPPVHKSPPVTPGRPK